MNKQIVCLLTGCINPPVGVAFTHLTDPAIRKAQYISALQYQLTNYSIPVVFVENSGTDISPDFAKEIRENKIEIITFQGNNYPARLGKGVGEFNCLQYAVTHSKYIAAAGFIFKITGRYQVHNLHQFIQQWQRATDIYLLTDTSFPKQFTDTRFFGFQPGFVNHYLSQYAPLLNDSEGIYFEHIMFKALLAAMIEERKVDIFYGSPKIAGIAGSMNQPYQSGWVRHLFRDVRGKIKYFIFHHS